MEEPSLCLTDLFLIGDLVNGNGSAVYFNILSMLKYAVSSLKVLRRSGQRLAVSPLLLCEALG